MIKIYLTNLRKYNEGELVGEWVTLPKSEEEMQEVFERIGINEEYEEFFITDYETDGIKLYIGEFENLELINEAAEVIADLEDYEIKLLQAISEMEGHLTLQEIIDINLDNYTLYEDMEMIDVAYDIIESCYDLDKMLGNLAGYFDYEAFARDLSFDGYYETSYGVVCSC